MTVPPAGGEVLRQSIGYALASTDLVTPALLTAPTPCAEWDLGMLLRHLSDSLDVLAGAIACGSVRVQDAPGCLAGGDAAAVRVRCARLLATIPAVTGGRLIAVTDESPFDGTLSGGVLTDGVLACTGAIEVCVHGWDIAAACGSPRPIPSPLAGVLLRAAYVLVPGDAREGLFGDPLPPPALAGPADRLLAFLGRSPAR